MFSNREYDDDDFQPLNLLGKGNHQTPKKGLSAEAQALHDIECAKIASKHEAQHKKIEATRKLHKEILKEYPSLSPTQHILDELDTPEKIRNYLDSVVAIIAKRSKPILKKK